MSPPGDWTHVAAGTAVVISSFVVRAAPDADISINFTPSGSDVAISVTIDPAELEKATLSDFAAVLQRELRAQTDLEVLVSVDSNGALAFSEVHYRKYTIEVVHGAAYLGTTAAVVTRYMGTEPVSFGTPIGSPHAIALSEAIGGSRYETTLYARMGVIPTNVDGKQGDPAVLLFATAEEAEMDFSNTAGDYGALVDIGPSAFVGVLYDRHGRRIDPTKSIHRVSLRNENLMSLSSEFVNALLAFSPSGMVSEVPLVVNAGGVINRRVPSGIQRDSWGSFALASRSAADPNTTTTVCHLKQLKGNTSEVALLCPSAEVANAADTNGYPKAMAKSLSIRPGGGVYVRGEVGHPGQINTNAHELRFSMPHGLSDNEPVFLVGAPQSGSMPYKRPTDPTIPHFFRADPLGMQHATTVAEHTTYLVDRIDATTIALKFAAAPHNRVPLGAFHDALAARDYDASIHGVASGGVLLHRAPPAPSTSRAPRDWDTVYVCLDGVSAEGRDSLSTDNVAATGHGMVFPVARQLCNQHLPVRQRITSRALEKTLTLVIKVGGPNAHRPARFDTDDPDVSRVDVCLTVTQEMDAKQTSSDYASLSDALLSR
jgi:hypothetical protein